MGDDSVNLPPGFRFCPTDEELVLHFLYHKASLLPFHPNIIPDLDLCLHDPWDFINGKTLSSGSTFYFFSKVTENRFTKKGYWMDLDIDEPVLTSAGKKVGIKKHLVFYIGQAPGQGYETAWIMQEYHLCNYGVSGAFYNRRVKRKDRTKWVLCRVHERTGNFAECFCCSDDEDNGTELSSLDEMYLSTIDDDLDEINFS